MENSQEKLVNGFLNAIKKNKDGVLLDLIQNYGNDEVFVKHLIDIIENQHGSMVRQTNKIPIHSLQNVLVCKFSHLFATPCTCIKSSLCNISFQQSDSICETLFTIYSVGQQNGILFCMQFVPALLWGYYSILSHKVKWNSSKIEVVLLAIYNKVVQQYTQNAFSSSFKLPNIWKQSIYHEPFATLGGTTALTENALSQHEKSDSPILVNGPIQHLDRIPAGFRSVVVKTILQQYNAYITSYPKSSLISMCNLIIRLSVCGYQLAEVNYKHISKDEFQLLQKYPKVALNGDVIKEMTTSLHFILYNGLFKSVFPVLKILHMKAQYTLSSAGILNTNALLNLIELSTKRCEDDFQLLPVIDPTKVNYRGKVNTPVNNQPFHKELITTPFNTQTPSKSTSPPIDTLKLSQSTPFQCVGTEDKPSASSLTSPPLASADLSPGQLRSSSKRTSTDDLKVDNEAMVTVNKKLEFHDNLNEQDNFKNVSDMNKPLSATQNLHRIEDELIEYSINTDKTPLINGTRGGNYVGVDATSSKIASPLKTLYNSEENITNEETKM